jgi:hypothetical protein
MVKHIRDRNVYQANFQGAKPLAIYSPSHEPSGFEMCKSPKQITIRRRLCNLEFKPPDLSSALLGMLQDPIYQERLM